MALRPDFLSPLHLSAPVHFTGSTSVSYDETLIPFNFTNPNKTAMLVDEFRYTPWENAGTNFLDILAPMNIDLRMGPIPLTNKAIPFFSLFPSYIGERDPLAASYGYPGNPQTDTAWTYHLPCPLYVPRDLGMYVRFQCNVFGGIVNLYGTFSMIGRSISEEAPRPARINVPWSTGFRAPPDVESYVTRDSEMVNSFISDLHLTNFLGFDIRRSDQNLQLGDVLVQMTRSANRLLVRDPTPFRLLFPPATGLMQTNAVLAQNDFIRVELKAPDGSEDSNLNNVCVGMTGYREIDTPGIP